MARVFCLYFLPFLLVVLIPEGTRAYRLFISPQDSTDKLKYPINSEKYENAIPDEEKKYFDFEDPSNVTKEVEYDLENNEYIFKESMGDRFYRNPGYMSFEDYYKYEEKKSKLDYWKQLAGANDLLYKKTNGPKLVLPDKDKDRIFGSNAVEIRPQGNVDLTFGWRYQNIQNPAVNIQAQKYGAFNFDMDIRLNVQGKIGELMAVNLNFNSKATFDFDNQLKLAYTGDEDGIIKKIEAGNVSLPINGSLVQGAQNLFGIKTQLQFGRLTVTNVIARKESKVDQIQIQGGGQVQEFRTAIDEYDDNRHFFLAHYFREHYNEALANLPVINSLTNITRIEVWVTNQRGYSAESRDIVGFMDMGENNPYRSDVINSNMGNDLPYAYSLNTNLNSNNLYQNLINDPNTRSINSVTPTLENNFNLQAVQDFEKTYARLLSASEYTLNPQLGFISLNSTLNPNEILAVAFEYVYNGEVYQVGEFSQDVPQGEGTPQVLFLKLLKSTSLRTNLPMWDLMMKNIYSIGGWQINQEDFQLNVTYLDPGGGERRYIPEGSLKGIPLISVLNLDRLNNQGDNMPDGIFDFIPGVTILPNNGRIIFPVVEPFGEDLRKIFEANGENLLASKYVYQQLYDSTKFLALQFPEFNRYAIAGSYKSKVSNEISLGSFNIPRGSVNVTAGGQLLTEGVDYTVDYNIGRVRILNDGILNAGVPIKINFENNNLFGFQQKTLFGSRFDYYINDQFTLGGTILRLTQRPWTYKVNVGDDPIASTIYGLDGSFKKESPWLTRAIDKLPIVETKAPSVITVSGEIARLNPGHSKAIGESGVAYVDDFEGTSSSYDLKFPNTSWQLASTPRGAIGPNSNELFPESAFFDSLAYGYNRAKLAWYTIDPLFLRDLSTTPEYIKNNKDLQSSHYVREIVEQEIFPQRSNNYGGGVPNVLRTLNLAYFPNQRGPYNFDVTNVNSDGTLKNPDTRWGGIMRNIINSNFEASNVEFMEFWLMDPFLEDPNLSGGDLYINLGNVSEDILKDSRRQFENGLPKLNDPLPNVDTTKWGVIPNGQSIVNAFDSDPEVRAAQDVGLDGLSDEGEKTHFKQFLDAIKNVVSGNIFSKLEADPASDNFHHYQGSDYDNAQLTINDRYREFNGTEGNSPATSEDQSYSTAGTTLPDNEDINKDNTLNETEEYYQYRVEIKANKLAVGQNFIVNQLDSVIQLKNGNTSTVKWYQFRIPITAFETRVGNIPDFRSIRFIRMFLTGFTDSVILRFGTFDLVRNQWRRYNGTLKAPGEFQPNENEDETFFNVYSVSFEEHGSKKPVNYVLPNGIYREQTLGGTNTNVIYLNEQSLSLQTCDLKDGDMKAVFKSLNLDIRNFKRLKMYMHAESVIGETPLKDGDVSAVIRIGSDYTANYYEYEIPLKISQAGNYDNDNVSDKFEVWPEENELDIPLDTLTLLKILRQEAKFPFNLPYSITDSKGNKITIIGNPDLGNAKVAMIGIRNPKAGTNLFDDDGLPKCAEVWFNELRLVEFFEQGGWAALGRADLKLADLGNVSLSGNFHTIGFGSLEQQLAQRAQDNYYQYDLAGSLNLSKFLPRKLGLQLPMYAGISESFSNPRFDPYQSDLLFATILDNAETIQEQDSLKKVAQTYTSIKSINFTNVKKIKTKKDAKNHIYDVENLSFTYAYSETFKRNPIIEYDNMKKYKGAMTYGFSPKPKYITPFGKLKAKNLGLVKDFNFNLIPTDLSFRTEMNRQFGESIQRKQNADDIQPPSTFNKFFTWDRFYGFKYNLTKSMTADFAATNNARIDEPFGRIDTEEKKDSIITNINKLGRNTHYNQTTNINYNVPINKVPMLDWVRVNTRYSTSYDWLAIKPFTADSIGNTIQNKQTQQVNFDFQMNTLYRKVKFLDKYANKRPPPRKGKAKQEEEKSNKALDFMGTAIVGVKTISINYSEDKSTILPGFAPKAKYLGMNPDNTYAPGLNFVFGYQPDEQWLSDHDAWLTTASTLAYQFAQTQSKNLTARSNIEPIKDMRIDLNFSRNYTLNHSQYFRLDSLGHYEALNTYDAGSFTMSANTWATAFDKRDKNTGISFAFQEFSAYREIISARLTQQNPNSNGIFNVGDTLFNKNYYDGYGPYSQDVLIPAFWAAYTGKDPNAVDLDFNEFFKIFPKPNWRITYNGLNKLPLIKKYISSITVSHAYSSTFSMNSFVSNLRYLEDPNGNQLAKDSVSGNFMAVYKVPQVSISEQLSPLIGFNITWKNNMTNRIEYKKTRNISMSFLNYQLAESKTADFTFGLGYKYKGLKLPLKNNKGKQIVLKNDVNFKIDFTIRDNVTIIYQLDQDLAQPTRGIKSYSINPSIDYVVNNRVNLRIFFDRLRSLPATSNAYPSTIANFGVVIRFNLTP